MSIERGKILKKEMLSESTVNRLMKYIKKQPNGCWQWVGYMWKWYGYIHSGKKHRLAHRVSYVLFVGDIRSRMDIHHKCNNSLCVNPNHLEQVTRTKHKVYHAQAA